MATGTMAKRAWFTSQDRGRKTLIFSDFKAKVQFSFKPAADFFVCNALIFHNPTMFWPKIF